MPGRFSHVLSACLIFFLPLTAGRALISKNGPRFSPSRTGPRAHHSALLYHCAHYLAECEVTKIMSNLQSEAPYIVDDKKSSIDSVPPPLLNDHRAVARPPIDFSSFSAFCHSTWRRFLSLWTRQFTLSLLAGQVVSLCITCTNVTTEELSIGKWQIPTTQTFFLYQTFFFL